MSRKIILSLGFFIAFVLFALGTTLPTSTVKADALLQGAPRLEGFKIYFTEANGEASRFDRGDEGMSRLAGILWQLGAELATLEWRTGIPEDADLIIIAGPDFISPDQTARLWSYLEANGSVLLLTDPQTGTGRNISGLGSGEGIFTLTWSDVGVRVRDDTIVTEQAGADAILLADNVVNPTLDSDHPVTAGLSSALSFYRTRSIEIDTSSTVFDITPLMFSPGNYYGETAFNEYLNTGEARYNIGDDTARGPLIMAVAAENPATNTRIVIMGDSDFMTNGFGLQTSPAGSDGFLYPDNIRFVTSLIGWMVGADPANAVELEFPTPGPTSTPSQTPTQVVTVADMGVVISSNTTNPRANDAMIFTVQFTNNGPEDAIGVVGEIDMPLDVTYLTSTVSGRYGFDPDTGVIDIGTLQPSETATITIVVLVNQGSEGRDLATTARVSAQSSTDSETANDVASLEIPVQSAEG